MTDDDAAVADDRSADDGVDYIADRLIFFFKHYRGRIRPEDGRPYNQKNLAEFAGCTPAYVSKLMNSKGVRVSFGTVDRMALYFGQSTDVFRPDFPWVDKDMAQLCAQRDAKQEREWRVAVRYRLGFMLEVHRGKIRPDGAAWTVENLVDSVTITTNGKYGEDDVQDLMSNAPGAEEPSLATRLDLLAAITAWFGMKTTVLLPDYEWTDKTVAEEMELSVLAAEYPEFAVFAARQELPRSVLLSSWRAVKNYQERKEGERKGGEPIRPRAFRPTSAEEGN